MCRASLRPQFAMPEQMLDICLKQVFAAQRLRFDAMDL